MSKMLIVVDMQVDFVTGILGSENAQAIIPNVLNKIKEYLSAGHKVNFTLDSHYEHDYLNSREGKHLPIPHCIMDTDGRKLIPEIENLIESYKDKKITLFGFDNVNQIDFLPKIDQFGLDMCELSDPYDVEGLKENLESIEFIGVATNMCVLSCVICSQNMYKHTEHIVDASCCASFDTELHNKTLDIMESIQIQVINR